MNHKAIACFVFSALLLPSALAHASDSDGTIQSPDQYAWADSGGWVNFAAPQGNVHVTDSGLTGQAWIDNYGWINLDPSQGGVTNDGNGNLAGTAWGANIGWVYFTGVAINSSGQFTGSATSDNIGNVNFDCVNCTVTTDWRPASSRHDVCGDAVCSGSETCNSCPQDCGACPATGNNAGGNYYSPTMLAPGGGFGLTINNGEQYTTSTSVQLQLSGGDATSLDVSNYPDFQDAMTFSYVTSIPWQLLVGDGTKTIYVRFHNANNQTSAPVLASIILDTKAPSVNVNQLPAFWSDQPVIVSGTTDADSQIIISFADKYGIAQSDSNGNWTVNLGILAAGSYPVVLNVKNPAGNSESLPLTLTVQQRPVIISFPPPPVQQTTTPAAPLVLNNLLQNITQKITSLLGPAKVKTNPPAPVITVPQELPAVLSHAWNLLPVQAQIK